MQRLWQQIRPKPNKSTYWVKVHTRDMQEEENRHILPASEDTRPSERGNRQMTKGQKTD